MSAQAAGDGDRRGTFLGHPIGLYVLFVVEMWERFSYYGMRALLVLYLKEPLTGTDNPGRGWAEGQANLLYGWYTGLAYLLPLAGGYLADRFLGTHRSIVIGSVLIAIGHVLLAISGLGGLATNDLGMSVFIGGLAVIIIGTGYFKPSSAVMVGQLYPADDPRRDAAYTVYYMGVNLGAFLCAFVCGTLGEQVGWHWGFGSAAVGMVAGLTVYLIFKPIYLPSIGARPTTLGPTPTMLFTASLLLAVAVAAYYHAGGFGQLKEGLDTVNQTPVVGPALPFALGGLAVAWVVWFVASLAPGERGPVCTIFIFMVFNALFWMAFEQTGSTLNVFAKESTDRQLFDREVPATWFQSVNPAFILLLGPVMAWLWSSLGRRRLNPTQPVKIGLGLLLVGVGFVFMVAAGQLSAGGARVGMFWLVATYFFNTVGELTISPTGLSYVTRAAPARYVALLMGLWYISNFMANLGSGIVASYVQDVEKGKIIFFPWVRLGGRADFFLLFVVSSVGAGLLILILTPFLRRLLPRGA